ncbi:MAG: hypothetical protein ACOY93_13750 [Bacillota bacterium]
MLIHPGDGKAASGRGQAYEAEMGRGIRQIRPGEIEAGMDVEQIYQYYRAGWWWEPAAPPASTAVLRLDQPQTRVASLLLRANIPSTVRLQGPADLLFHAFVIRLTARSLIRNLARPEWGSSRAVSGADPAWQEILLAAPARIEAVGVRTARSAADVEVRYKEGDYRTYVQPLHLNRFRGGRGKYLYSGYHEQAVLTQAVQVKLEDEDAEILLSSPSLPSRVALALGDDTPAQLFPAEMALEGTATSRDLTGQINAAWRRGSSGGEAEVQLRITSLTDGVVQVDLDGAWGRSYAGPEQSLALDSLNPAVLELPWPFGEAPEASASLRIAGRIEGGRRLELAPGNPTFSVRATERLEVAQAVRLAAGEAPAEKRRLLAVWLMLPGLPRAEERLEIRLAEASGEPPFPSDQPLAQAELTLPADAGAYVAAGGGFWFRAALEKPVELDGAQATRPLFVVAAGREGGSLLAHRSLGVPPEGALRIPAGAGAGAALARNLDRTGSWELQAFNREAALWLIDLELEPLPAERAELVVYALGTQPPQALPLPAPDRISLQTPGLPVPRPSDEKLVVTFTSAIRASLTAQLSLYKPIVGHGA